MAKPKVAFRPKEPVVVGSGIFTAAISFTRDGCGGLMVIADAEGDAQKKAMMFVRQRPDGALEAVGMDGLPSFFDEHPGLRELWDAWHSETKH